jgi:hypothetical protein
MDVIKRMRELLYEKRLLEGLFGEELWARGDLFGGYSTWRSRHMEPVVVSIADERVYVGWESLGANESDPVVMFNPGDPDVVDKFRAEVSRRLDVVGEDSL